MSALSWKKLFNNILHAHYTVEECDEVRPQDFIVTTRFQSYFTVITRSKSETRKSNPMYICVCPFYNRYEEATGNAYEITNQQQRRPDVERGDRGYLEAIPE